ncbi:SPASM domain-containing protein [Pedobacter sp. KACC 23697]|uniref:Radical SAM/SPASM domain-containing protein n=1 Tax=Pedobacter sp. KACC 23697 TaxID=3149230 RepID=A0AAU7KBH7_9SPHI
MIKEMIEDSHWAEICNRVVKDDNLRELFANAILNIKTEVAAICLREAENNAPSPLKFLSNYWNGKPSANKAELAIIFKTYIERQKERSTSVPFSTLINQTVERLVAQLQSALPTESVAVICKIGISDILNAPGSPDPIGIELQKILAGLPPADATASTNIGLPRPENHQHKFHGRFCQFPFDFAQIDPLGQMYLCCPQTLPEAAGDLVSDTFMDTWNSPGAIAIRESILDGSFRYCSEATCGYLQSNSLPLKEEVKNPRHREFIDHHITRVEQGPLTINMSYDRSCNLSCPSCRKGMVVLKGKSKENAETIHDRVVNRSLKNVEELIITGSGDPFGSQLFHSFLRSFDPSTAPQLHITLSTNGLLLTPKTWGSICNTAISKIDISVDAGSAPTYMLNRGGNWNILLDNLDFVGKLRRAGKIKSFELHFVVQENNFREMKDFVEIGLQVSADFICFKQILNWGTYSEEEYLSRAVQLASHPLHQEFKKTIKDPIFKIKAVYMHDLNMLANS